MKEFDRIIDESWYFRPTGVGEHEAAGGVICRLEGVRVLVALIREGGKSAYSLPKGHVEEGESVEEAAVREIEEEAGLTDLRLIAPLGIQERLTFRKNSWKRTHYFLFTTNQIAGIPGGREKGFAMEWHPIDDLPLMFWPEQKGLIESNGEKIVGLVKEGRSKKDEERRVKDEGCERNNRRLKRWRSFTLDWMSP